jgi:hypothetical protein
MFMCNHLSARQSGWLILCVMTLAGCGSSIPDSTAPGPVDHGLYSDALLDNKQRLAGEDVRIEPLYKTPFEAIGVGFDVAISQPIGNFFDYITHDDPRHAARKMQDPHSADNQREGMLRLTDFKYARHDAANIKGYAIYARSAGDYTVRAAGLRALNRCRAQGYTALFMESLNDDQQLIRLEAADALGNIPDPQSVSLLIVHMQMDAEPNIDVRIACAEALRNFHTSEVMHALIDVLDDPVFGVAWQARQSLELLTGQDFRYDAKAWRHYLLTVGI